MTLPPPKVCRRIRRLHAMTQSPNANEAAIARSKLDVLLFEWSLTEADLSQILAGPAPSCLTRRIYVPNGQGQPMSKAMSQTLERLVPIRPRPRYAPQTGLRAKGMWRHDSIAGFGAITAASRFVRGRSRAAAGGRLTEH